MSEQNDSTVTELDLETSANAEQASDSETTSTDSQDQKSEQGEADLSFLSGEDKPAPTKEEAKSKTLVGQVNSAQKKIEGGKKSIDDFPEYIQEELRERGIEQTVQASAPKEVNQAQLVKQVVEQMKNQETFESLRGQLKEMAITSEQADSLKAEFKELKTSGLSDLKALETSVRLAGLTSKVQEARQQGIKMGQMALGSQGQVQTMRQPSQPDPLELTGDDFIKWAERQAADDMYHTKRRSTL